MQLYLSLTVNIFVKFTMPDFYFSLTVRFFAHQICQIPVHRPNCTSESNRNFSCRANSQQLGVVVVVVVASRKIQHKTSLSRELYFANPSPSPGHLASFSGRIYENGSSAGTAHGVGSENVLILVGKVAEEFCQRKKEKNALPHSVVDRPGVCEQSTVKEGS